MKQPKLDRNGWIAVGLSALVLLYVVIRLAVCDGMTDFMNGFM